MNTSSSSVASGSPELAIVVIARNEEGVIAQCLEAALAAATPYAGSRVVLVDSDSTDSTVDIAKRYPVTVYRYGGPTRSAAAGRRLGAERVDAQYVLFLDADCVLQPGWLPEALECMADPETAVVFGWRRDVYLHHGADFESQGPSAQEFGLGGNALYRKRVLDRVGGFNPFLRSEEEPELAARIEQAGYGLVNTRSVMFEHHTDPRDSAREMWRRFRSGLSSGPGPVLRVALRQGLLGHHVRRYNRYLLTLAYLLLGVVAAGTSLALGSAVAFLAWFGAGALAAGLLAAKRRSLRGAASILADWVSVAVHLIPGFVRDPRDASSFAPPIERLHGPD